MRRIFLLPLHFLHQQVDPVACQKTQGIQDQIVNIRHPFKGQLQDLNDQRCKHTGQNHLFMGIQLPEHAGPDDAQRDEHGGIANHIDQHLFENFIIHSVREIFLFLLTLL